MQLHRKIPFALLTSLLFMFSALEFASAQCAIEPIKPIPPLGCKDVTPQCVSTSNGQSYWTWICVPDSGGTDANEKREQQTPAPDNPISPETGGWPGFIFRGFQNRAAHKRERDQQLEDEQRKARLTHSGGADANEGEENQAPAQPSASGKSTFYGLSIETLKEQAASGDAEAQIKLGLACFLGQGVAQDYKQAVLWLRKAAEQGNADAQSALGELYSNGRGVPQDYAEAYFWLDIAAAGNLADKTRRGVVKYLDEAASHLTLADLSRVQERARKWFEDHPAKPQ